MIAPTTKAGAMFGIMAMSPMRRLPNTIIMRIVTTPKAMKKDLICP